MKPEDLAADFRSDTLTLPDVGMRAAMGSAELGDDVFGEDPTVNQLQKKMATLAGKPAALFFPSGSMANLTALMCHVGSGGALFTGQNSHINHYELGSYARIAGLSLVAVDDSAGFLDRKDLQSKWIPDIYYMPKPALITVENTHNMLGGKVYPIQELKALCDFANEKKIPVHMDGARLFHAGAGAGRDIRDWTEHVDSVMVALSKGLGCPVGSVLLGETDFIEHARVVRKLLGGGMRQAGVLAAAGLYALEQHMPCLELDIQRCRGVFEAFGNHESLRLVPPQSNILIGQLQDPSAAELVLHLAERGVKGLAISTDRVRFVFHLNNTEIGCNALLEGLLSWTRL